MWIAESLRQPGAEGAKVAFGYPMQLDNSLLAGFQRPIEIGCNEDVIGDELRRTKQSFHLRGKIRQHDFGAGVACGLLDLGKTLRRRGIDPGDAAKIENQKPAIRLLSQQGFNVLINAIDRAEEQITLQCRALNLPAMIAQYRLLPRSPIE